MRTTILFSAIGEVSTRFADSISGLSEFLAQGNVPIGTPAGLPALAEHLSVDGAFRDDLVSMLRVVCAAEPAISYLELLGLLLVATVGQKHADQLSADPACETDVRTIFNFLVEMRRTGRVDSEPFAEELPELDLPTGSFSSDSLNHAGNYAQNGVENGIEHEVWPAEAIQPAPPAASGAKVFSKARGETHAGLARALALAANDELPGEATRVDPIEPDRPAPVWAMSPAVTVADPVVLLSRAPERPTWSFTWSVAFCGVLLGLLLGVFLHRPYVLRPESHNGPAITPAAAALDAGTSSVPAASSASQGSLPAAGHRAFAGMAMSRKGETWNARPRPDRPVAPDKASYNGPARPSQDAIGAGMPVRPSSDAVAAGSSPLSGVAPGRAGFVSTAVPPKVSEVVLNTRADSGSAPLGRSQRTGRVLLGSAGIMAANLVSSPAPPYPAQASAAQVQGEVVVEAIVGREGDVIETRVVSGPPLLREAALRAVGRWRYRPYEVDGEAAEIATTARLDFRLDP